MSASPSASLVCAITRSSPGSAPTELPSRSSGKLAAGNSMSLAKSLPLLSTAWFSCNSASFNALRRDNIINPINSTSKAPPPTSPRSMGLASSSSIVPSCGGRCRYSRGFHDRRLPLRGEIRLQLGQLIIFQLNQTLQFIELTLQVTHAPFQLFVLAASGIQAFLSHRQLVAQRLAVGGTCVTATGCLAGIGGDQFQAVLSFRLGGSCAGDTAPGRIHLPCAGRNVTPLAPGGILFANLGHGFGLGAAFDLLLLRQAQHLAVLQAIDIAANKGIRIQILNGQHGLLYAAVTTHTLGDFP